MFELEVGTPSWGVAVEVQYVQKGAKFEGVTVDASGNPTGPLDLQLVLEYAEVPILVRGFMGRGSVRPYVVGGPTFGFALAARAKSERRNRAEPERRHAAAGPGRQRSAPASA